MTIPENRQAGGIASHDGQDDDHAAIRAQADLERTLGSSVAGHPPPSPLDDGGAFQPELARLAALRRVAMRAAAMIDASVQGNSA